jgi:hypothetical protein
MTLMLFAGSRDSIAEIEHIGLICRDPDRLAIFKVRLARTG